MFYSAWRAITFSWESTWRNFWLSLITVSTIVLTLFTVSFVIALHVGLEQIVQAAEKRIDLSVYFYPTVTDSQANSVITALRTITGVREVNYITKEQALANYEKKIQGTPELLAPLTAIGQNPFGSSLVIKGDDASVYERVIEELIKPQYQSLIEGQKKGFEENRLFITSFSAFTNKVRIAGLAVSLFFALIAALLIFNAIRVAIYTHREEIAIMKLVGATNWFVRVPFLVETIIYSVIAVSLNAALFFAFLYFLQPYLDQYFEVGVVNILGYFRENALIIFGGELLLIVILNVVSGSIALRRYLRV